jgi:hypothetical protein
MIAPFAKFKCARSVAEVTVGMRGSGSDWPAGAASEDQDGDPAAHRTGQSRLLLDELLAQRERAEAPAAPILTIDPVPVLPTGEVGRRAARRRLVELEDVARHNLRSAEEARAALAHEHARLVHEASVRHDTQREALLLHRELEKLRAKAEQETPWKKQQRVRDGSAAIRDEFARLKEKHERVVAELNRVREGAGPPDGLVEEYVARLREEQQARVTLQGEVTRLRAEAGSSALEGAEPRIAQLEARAEAAEERAREAERIQGRIRRDASEIAKAKRIAEQGRQDAERARHDLAAELDTVRVQMVELHEELVRIDADNDGLRAHAVALGDELASLRAAGPVAPALAGLPALSAVALDAPEELPATERSARSEASPGGARRHAMAELTAIAATSGDDDFAYRRR